jgi:hypothetical protein
MSQIKLNKKEKNRKNIAICECEYADAYNHSCLMLSYGTSEVCQSGENGKIIAKAYEDIKKVLLQRFVLIIKSIYYFETIISSYKQIIMLPRCNSPRAH